MSSDSEDDEDYAFYGSGLEAIEEDAVPKKKPFSLENQVVKDKDGKRRFHGAFTGGFSAGYWNTVGSSEGWTPSTFKSSRAEKASLATQKPEDFMDDEDVGEFGFAPRTLRAKSDYSSQRSELKRGHAHPQDGPIPGQPVMLDILKATRETVGAKLLRQMGWKPGQGVGPRLSRKEKLEQQRDIRSNKSKIYGCSLPTEELSKHRSSDGEESEEEDEELLPDITFAPDDYEPYLVKPKTDRFGIGYSGLDKRPVLSGHVNLFEPSFLGMQEKKKKVAITGQAFGVGALEDEDEDIYAKDDMSQYDFALETSASIAAKRREERDAERRRVIASASSRGQALEGFVPAKQSVQSQRKHFPLPTLPHGFVPYHTARTSRFENVEGSQASDANTPRQSLQSVQLNADSRARMLNEPVRRPAPVAQPAPEAQLEPVTKPAPSLTTAPSQPASIPLPSETMSDSAASKFKQETDSPTTSTGHSTFRPFAEDPTKQTRYEKYLDLSKRGLKDCFSTMQPATMTEWEKERERGEFEQAARIYKPLAGFMSDKFVSASQQDDTLNPLAKVERSQHGNEDLRAAAKMKMFGKLTRKISQWNPCALVCKRFNVPQPAMSTIPEAKSKSRFSVFDYLSASSYNTPAPSKVTRNSPEAERNAEEHLVQEIKTEPPEEQSSEKQSAIPTRSQSPIAPTTKPKSRWDCPYKVPPKNDAGSSAPKSPRTDLLSDIEFPEPPAKADLFKAIFLSSSEDSSDPESENEKEDKRSSSTPADKTRSEVADSETQPTPTKSIVRNLSPPRGIFANLDLDAINSKRASKPVPPPPEVKEVAAESSDHSGSEEDLMYGPKLPTNIPVPSKPSFQSRPHSSKLSEGRWVEKESVDKHHKHSKHKKQKKHKKHKSKSKHKKKS